MAQILAITATLNAATQHEVMLWYSENGYAALDLEKLEKFVGAHASLTGVSDLAKKPKGALLKDAATPEPPFDGSWSFAHASTKFMVYAFGVRESDKQVCLIGPTYQPLPNAKASSSSVAACGKTDLQNGEEGAKDTVWVFYLKKEQEGRPHLVKYSLHEDISFDLDTVKTDEASRLCAYWDKNGAFCFYLTEGEIHEYDSTTDHKKQSFAAKNVLKTTPLAVCFYHNTLFLFFLNSTHHVMVAKRNAKLKWTEVEEVKTHGTGFHAEKAALNTDLAAVADTINSRIILFYKHASSTKPYSHWVWTEPIP